MAKIYIPTFGVAPFDKPCRRITLRSDCLLSIKR